jgi:hypothetical protein
MLNQIDSETSEESKIKVQTNLDNIMTNNQNLYQMLERFYRFGAEDEDLNDFHEDSFFHRFIKEPLDPTGSLYLLQYEYYDEISESNCKEIYSNILLTNYNKAFETKNKLLKIIEFGKKFVAENLSKYDKIDTQIVLNKIVTDQEYEFFDEYMYFYEMSKITDVTIICLNINNSDWQLDQYFDKFLKPNLIQDDTY